MLFITLKELQLHCNSWQPLWSGSPDQPESHTQVPWWSLPSQCALFAHSGSQVGSTHSLSSHARWLGHSESALQTEKSHANKMNNDKVNFAYYMHCSLHNLSCKHKCLHDCFFCNERLLCTLDRVDLHIAVHLFHMQGDQDNGSLLCILKYNNDKLS